MSNKCGKFSSPFFFLKGTQTNHYTSRKEVKSIKCEWSNNKPYTSTELQQMTANEQ